MSPIKSVQEYFENVVVPTMRTLIMSMFGPAGLPPSPPPEEVEGPPAPSTGGPYRATNPAIPPPPAKASERRIFVTCVTRGDTARSKETVEAIKTKTKRRAIRYFQNLEKPGTHKEVRHRVTDRKPDSIEFGYFRRSSTPLHVRWHLEPHAEIQDQK